MTEFVSVLALLFKLKFWEELQSNPNPRICLVFRFWQAAKLFQFDKILIGFTSY